jgi:hypothetical protein
MHHTNLRRGENPLEMYRTDTTDYGKRVCILNTTCDAAKKYKQYDKSTPLPNPFYTA